MIVSTPDVTAALFYTDSPDGSTCNSEHQFNSVQAQWHTTSWATLSTHK